MAAGFLAHEPTTEDYWRSIILFGRNVASYKFALGRALLDLRPEAGRLVTLEELAVPFSRHIRDHLRTSPKQGTASRSRFLDACRAANDGEVPEERLAEETARLGFANVIDAFHVVGRGSLPIRFFVDERRTGRGIRMTDEFARLAAGAQADNLPGEADARWRLVETAWELRVARALLAVSHDEADGTLFVVDGRRRRRSVTGAREALSGYQKGHCFYCFDAFSLARAGSTEVDHFFPHALKGTGFGASVDGVWNLVLACTRCNRGVEGKSDGVPTLRLLERLSRRNEFLISSHHPLRETLIAQTGADDTRRAAFLYERYREARSSLIHEWQPAEAGRPRF